MIFEFSQKYTSPLYIYIYPNLTIYICVLSHQNKIKIMKNLELCVCKYILIDGRLWFYMHRINKIRTKLVKTILFNDHFLDGLTHI